MEKEAATLSLLSNIISIEDSRDLRSKANEAEGRERKRLAEKRLAEKRLAEKRREEKRRGD